VEERSPRWGPPTHGCAWVRRWYCCWGDRSRRTPNDVNNAADLTHNSETNRRDRGLLRGQRGDRAPGWRIRHPSRVRYTGRSVKNTE
jgi:hypothetical protein